MPNFPAQHVHASAQQTYKTVQTAAKVNLGKSPTKAFNFKNPNISEPAQLLFMGQVGLQLLVHSGEGRGRVQKEAEGGALTCDLRL